jgi:dihydroflavonol-4-reductase
LAASKGIPGERYILSGATLTVRDGVALVARLTGVERPVRTVAPRVALAAATAAEMLAWVHRDTPRICRELVRTLVHGHAYDGSKAAQALTLRYTPIEETLRRTIDWWIAQGLVDRPESM